MPIEFKAFRRFGGPVFSESTQLAVCPLCLHHPFVPEFRGMTQRSCWLGLRKTYCAVVCDRCLEIVGWESADAVEFVFDRKVSKERRRMAVVAGVLGS